MGLFKTSDELLEKGQDLVKQREFGKAQEVFERSAEKAKKNGDNDILVISNALAMIMALSGMDFAVHKYVNAQRALLPLGEGDIKIGIRTIKASTLVTECQITAEELNAQGAPRNLQGIIQRAEMLQNIGAKYQMQIGNNKLFIPELFTNRSETGIQRSMRLFAESQESMAEATVWTDPKRAAEFYQNAMNYRKQIGDAQKENLDLIKVAQYSKSASCWFCGREITGEGIHFFPMTSDLTSMLRETKTDSPLPSIHASENVIYACRGCHTAISIKAEEIALNYHNIAMAKLQEVYNSLQSQINDLKRTAHHH